MTLESMPAGDVLRVATRVGLVAGVNLATGLYVLAAVQRPLIGLVTPNPSHAGALVVINYLGLGAAAALLGPLRRWDPRAQAAVAGVVQLAALAVVWMTPEVFETPAVRSIVLAASALALGLGGIPSVLFWPYLMQTAERAGGTAPTIRASARMYVVWGFTVTGLFQLGTWLVDQHDRGWVAALGLHVHDEGLVAVLALHIVVVLVVLPQLRALPPDERPLVREPPAAVWRRTFVPVLRPREYPSEALAFWVSVLSGAVLAAVFAGAGLTLDAWGEQGFTPWLGAASLVAVLALYVLQPIGARAVLVLSTAWLVVASLVAVALVLVGLRSGWIVVALIFFTELCVTANSSFVAPLMLRHDDERQPGNALLYAGKNGFAAPVAITVPALFGYFGDPLAALIVVPCLAIGLALLLRPTLTVSREEIVAGDPIDDAGLLCSSSDGAICTPLGRLRPGDRLVLGRGRRWLEVKRSERPRAPATDPIIGARTQNTPPLADGSVLQVRSSRRAACRIEPLDAGVLLIPMIEGFGRKLPWRIVRISEPPERLRDRVGRLRAALARSTGRDSSCKCK